MVGNLKYTGSSGFDLFLDDFLKSDYRDVVIDLSEASFIDSTNLGLIARVAERARSLGRGPVTLISPGDDINRVLRSVRFDRIFRIIESADSAVSPVNLPGREVGTPEGEVSEKRALEMILRAHRALITLDEENRDEFQDVVDLLEKS